MIKEGAYSSGRLLMSDPESVAAFSDKFIVNAKFVVDYLKHLEVMEFKKKKRAERSVRGRARKPRKKSNADYAWKDLCEDSTKLKQLRVPELNKYLKHHRLHQHIKSLKMSSLPLSMTRKKLRGQQRHALEDS